MQSFLSRLLSVLRLRKEDLPAGVKRGTLPEYPVKSFSRERLLEQLNAPRLVNWPIDLYFGQEAYAFLMDAFDRNALNRWQKFNGLHAVFTLGLNGHAEGADVVTFFVKQSKSDDYKLRSDAVSLAYGFIMLKNKHRGPRLELPKEQEDAFRLAIQRGIQPRARYNINEYYGRGRISEA